MDVQVFCKLAYGNNLRFRTHRLIPPVEQRSRRSQLSFTSSKLAKLAAPFSPRHPRAADESLPCWMTAGQLIGPAVIVLLFMMSLAAPKPRDGHLAGWPYFNRKAAESLPLQHNSEVCRTSIMRRNSHTLRGFLSIRCWRVDIADVAITGTRQNSVIYTGPFGEKGGPCDVSK